MKNNHSNEIKRTSNNLGLEKIIQLYGVKWLVNDKIEKIQLINKDN